MYQWVFDNFNNRELAAIFWFVVLVIFFFWHKDMRQNVFKVLNAFLDYKLIILFLSLAICLSLVSLGGIKFGILSSNEITAIIVWYFLGGLPLLNRSFNVKRDTRHFRGYAKDAVSATVFLEFIFFANTFNFVVELMLMPIITSVVIMAAIAETKPEYSSVKKLMNFLLLAFGLVIIWNSVSIIWTNPETFFVEDNYRSFILPIFLSIGLIPYFYFVFCYSKIESLCISLDHVNSHPKEIKGYAKKRFFLTFLLRPWLFDRAVRQFQILPAKSTADVDNIIDQILQYERDQENPPEVDPAIGWSPFKAREFLIIEELRTEDYHRSYDSIWWSGVASKELDGGLLPSTANYSFRGVEGVVKNLRLKGHFHNEFMTNTGLQEFSRIGLKLLDVSLARIDNKIKNKVESRQVFSIMVDDTKVSLTLDEFLNGKGFELILELTR